MTTAQLAPNDRDVAVQTELLAERRRDIPPPNDPLEHPALAKEAEQGRPPAGGGPPSFAACPATQLAVPRYKLTLEVGRGGIPHAWRFVLRPSDGHRALAVEDLEPGVCGEQLELLTLVRGLEALDQPSAVTAYGCSRYLRHGITYGLPEWRENGWQWERFGQMVAIKHAELWQRLDRAVQIHHLACGVRRIDVPHGGGDRHRHLGKRRAGVREGFADWIRYRTQSLLLAVARAVPQTS